MIIFLPLSVSYMCDVCDCTSGNCGPTESELVLGLPHMETLLYDCTVVEM